MLYRDLRGWLQDVDSFGELWVVEGDDCNQEIGAVAEVAARSEASPAVLFDKIKDYPAGQRDLTDIRSKMQKWGHPLAGRSRKSSTSLTISVTMHRVDNP